MEIFRDFSVKFKVDDEELECVRNHITRTEASTDSAIGTTEKASGTVEYEDNLTTDSVIYATASLDYLVESTEASTETSNQIVKSSSVESSMEQDTTTIPADSSCTDKLQKIESRISSYEFQSLTTEENSCMQNKLTEKEVESAYKYIALRNSTTSSEVDERNENLKYFILKTIENLIECTDMFGFTDVIDNLFPQLEAE